MGDVIFLDNETRLDIPADRVIEAAVGELEKAIVIGWDKEGGFYIASSVANGAEVLWLLEKAKQRLMEIGDEDGNG